MTEMLNSLFFSDIWLFVSQGLGMLGLLGNSFYIWYVYVYVSIFLNVPVFACAPNTDGCCEATYCGLQSPSA